MFLVGHIKLNLAIFSGAIFWMSSKWIRFDIFLKYTVYGLNRNSKKNKEKERINALLIVAIHPWVVWRIGWARFPLGCNSFFSVSRHRWAFTLHLGIVKSFTRYRWQSSGQVVMADQNKHLLQISFTGIVDTWTVDKRI